MSIARNMHKIPVLNNMLLAPTNWIKQSKAKKNVK